MKFRKVFLRARGNAVMVFDNRDDLNAPYFAQTELSPKLAWNLLEDARALSAGPELRLPAGQTLQFSLADIEAVTRFDPDDATACRAQRIKKIWSKLTAPGSDLGTIGLLPSEIGRYLLEQDSSASQDIPLAPELAAGLTAYLAKRQRAVLTL